MLRLRALIVLPLFCALCVSLAAQAPGTGLYAFGSFDNRGFDTINTGNLNIHFEIPIVNKPGRGQAFNYSLVYDGLLWSPIYVNSTQQWQPDAGWGFHGQLNAATTQAYVGYFSFQGEVVRCQDSSVVVSYSNYSYYDAFGQQHTFNYAIDGCTGNTIGDGSSSDGSGYRINNPGYYFSSVDVFNRYGTKITLQTDSLPVAITDSNGNVSSNNGDGTFTDTLGTTALTITGGGSSTSPRIFTYKVAEQADGSATAAATVSYVTYTVQTNFGCTQIQEYGADGNTQIDLVDRVTLADGTYYRFTYEATPGGVSGAVTGRIASVTLPTGGTVSYTYGAGCGNGLNGDGTVGNLTRVTSDGTRSYIRGPISGGSETYLQDEKGNWSLYKFVTANGLIYETHRQNYQGNISGTPLLEQYSCYNSAQPPCDGGTITLPITQITTLASYDGGGQTGTNNYYDSSGMQTQAQVYDAANGGAVLQNTQTSYNSLEKPTAVSVQDGSGNTVMFTSYGYDESTPTTTSSIPQHNGAWGSQGNLTSVHVSSGSTYLDTTTTYYDTGVPIATTTPNGTTNFSYDSTQTWATTTTPPTPSSGIALSTSASYDSQSGALLSSTGMNSEQTQVTQYDRLLRPKIVSLPIGQINISYPSANEVLVSRPMGNGHDAITDTLVDAYGRTSRVAISNGQSNPNTDWYQVDYCYDAAGLLQFQSVPYAGPGFIASKQCSGNGTGYLYDALGRVTSISNADGPTTIEHSGRAVKTTDVNGIKKITQYDLLGRLSAVCEISSNNNMPGSGSPGPCNTDFAGETGFVTTYSYSTSNPNRVTTIQQGTQTRSFTIDPAGRTVQTVEPERGTTNYSYSYNATGLQVVRSRPRANPNPKNPTTNTTTQYDKLGRVVSISYDDGITPTKTYGYDTAAGWTNFTQSNLKGRMSYAYVNSSGYSAKTAYNYDSIGNVLGMIECLPTLCGSSSHDKQLSFSYDGVGNLTSEGDGASGLIHYDRSPAGEVTAITNQTYQDSNNPANLVSNVVNGPFGPTMYDLGNGRSAQTWYDSMGRFYQQVICSTSTKTNCYGTQIYGEYSATKGSQTTVSCDTVLNECFTYGYDDMNRLTSASGNTHTYSYGYDRYGNRWQSNTTSSNPGFDVNTNRVLTYSYDAAGNVLSDSLHSYTYDAEGNVLKVDGGSAGTYGYDALNNRVSVQGANGSYGYLFDYAGKRISGWLQPSDFGNQGRIYWDGMQIAYRAWDGSTYFDHKDWIGTERMRTDHAGSISSTYVSLPFGEGYTPNENNPTGNALDNQHFALLDHDTESGTEHAQFRQYSPNVGRWLSPDPYGGSYDGSDPQSFNRYSYVGNVPLTFADPIGWKPGDPLPPENGVPTIEGAGLTGCGFSCFGWGFGGGGVHLEPFQRLDDEGGGGGSYGAPNNAKQLLSHTACTAAATAAGASGGALLGGGIGGVVGGAAGAGGGTLVAPGVGTIGGGVVGAEAGAGTGAWIGGFVGGAIGNIVGNVLCSKGGGPSFGGNQRENKQANDAKNEAERITGKRFTPAQERIFHDEITGQNYGYHELVQIAVDVLEGRI